MAVRTLPPSARRPIAALWFAAFAALATFLFFLRLSMGSHLVILYIVLPSVSAGIAGYIWGGAILDSSKVTTYGRSLLRGLGVSAGAYLIFGVLYGCVLPLLEGVWSLRQAAGLYLLALVFGPLMVGPLVAITGMTAGVTLFRFGRHLFAESSGRTSEASIV